MQELREIKIKNNDTNLRILINGIPDLKIIPKEEADIVISALELQITKLYTASQSLNK